MRTTSCWPPGAWTRAPCWDNAPNRVEGELGDGFYAQYWNENRPNRSDRLITARRSRAFPLIFTVGISEQEIYSRAAFRQKVYLGGALLLTFIILAATTFHWRRQQALDRAHRELRDFVSKFEDALRNLPQGLSMFDGRDRLIAFNRQWLELYGLIPEDIRIGMDFREVFAKQTAVLDVEAYLVDLKNRLAPVGADLQHRAVSGWTGRLHLLRPARGRRLGCHS
ncbi:PAS-domain containing protein [Bradyrhizobium sp. WSM1743]|uniref:PAS-domain containing protein n=1 Tax=Bradyrhizobium sp. WSM1743 TaxID=318996 RepID=UPI000A0129C4|nr:PAS-domain containing protein [Bradyrhizobium sp. WSM1743]